MSHTSYSSAFAQTGSHLRVDGVSVSFTDRRVLTDISFIISPSDRVGLIGENGSGKSTLLRTIAGLLEPNAGTISVNGLNSSTAKIGLLHQEPPFKDIETVADALESAVASSRTAIDAVGSFAVALAESPDDDSLADAYSRALEEADRLGAWDVDTRISATMSGLGLAGFSRDRLTGELSGGQRARLALAWLLLSRPDVLLLDEPTNHLDDAATDYLISVLNAWDGPVLMASHDRSFLDEASTYLLDLDPSPIPHGIAGPLLQDGPGTGIGVTRFTGTYSEYLAVRAEAKQRWERQYRDQQAELRRLRASVREQQTVGHSDWKPRSEVRMAQKFYSDRNAKVVARRVNDARARLHELEESQIRKPPTELKFRGLITSGVSVGTGPVEPVVTATETYVADRLMPTSLSISRGEKWLITGPNGSGKSTLLSILAGNMEPTGGHVFRTSTDSIKLLAQEISLPDPSDRGPTRTVLDTYRDSVGPVLAQVVPLNTFGLISARDHNRPVAKLSVGQQRRLALAVLLADPPDILLLDEPTNHFSLSLVTALETALEEYPGTVVIASHDRWLRANWEGRRMQLPQG